MIATSAGGYVNLTELTLGKIKNSISFISIAIFQVLSSSIWQMTLQLGSPVISIIAESPIGQWHT